MDTPSSGSITYITSPNSSTTTQVITSEDGVNQDLGTETGYYNTSPSQLQYSRNTGGGSTQQTTPQTPNTPSSIPDIILTDFSSSTTDDLTKPSLASAMSGSFDSDLFPSDETLRAGLGPIDFDGFQMLTDPDMNVISDPSAEDHFRLDRLDRL
ncbi:hypothetical protein RUM44_011605 [Polyplax serrata]|uniref:Transducer of regulated CREB activity C-terminal domain-containing protein n=1 Tax=Polyplax serrata TaxID=468196 RepID=A0ABR1AQH6_POLSC